MLSLVMLLLLGITHPTGSPLLAVALSHLLVVSASSAVLSVFGVVKLEKSLLVGNIQIEISFDDIVVRVSLKTLWSKVVCRHHDEN